MNKRFIQGNLFGFAIIAMAVSAIGVQHESKGLSSVFTTDGLPPQKGETVAENFAVEYGDQRYEVDGVCKYAEDAAICWKPDGSPHPVLSHAITAAIQSASNDSSSRQFSVTFGKKRRSVFMKETRFNRNRGLTSRYGSIFRPNRSQPGFQEGWGNSGSTNYSASSSNFDGSHQSWTSIEGAFNKETKEYPLRYMFQTYESKTITRPLEVGRLEIDGTIIEITSISDHPKVKQPAGPQGFAYGNYPEPLTDIKFTVVSAQNPLTQITIQLADQKGAPIGYIDAKGNPVSQEKVNEWYQQNNRPQPNGKPKQMPYIHAGAVTVDATNGSATSPMIGHFYVKKDQIKKLSFGSTKREMVVFDRIQLEPK